MIMFGKRHPGRGIRNTLQGIVAEPSAMKIAAYDTFGSTNYGMIVNFGSVCAVAALFINFFTKQQTHHPTLCLL